jgi:lysophospholipase L1-like esterase
VQALGGWTFLRYRMNNRGLGSEYDHRKSLYEKMPINKGDIVFLGNSLTAQCDWADLLDNPKIKNRGIPGDSSDGVLERLGLILEQKPSQIFLMIGINDLLFHPPEYVIQNYKSIVERIRNTAPETQLFLYSILPVNSQIRIIPIKNDDIRLINQSIQKIAADNDLIYIDLHTHFTNKDGALFAKFTSDGIHLNGDGYLLWKGLIEAYLENQN